MLCTGWDVGGAGGRERGCHRTSVSNLGFFRFQLGWLSVFVLSRGLYRATWDVARCNQNYAQGIMRRCCPDVPFFLSSGLFFSFSPVPENPRSAEEFTRIIDVLHDRSRVSCLLKLLAGPGSTSQAPGLSYPHYAASRRNVRISNLLGKTARPSYFESVFFFFSAVAFASRHSHPPSLIQNTHRILHTYDIAGGARTAGPEQQGPTALSVLFFLLQGSLSGVCVCVRLSN